MAHPKRRHSNTRTRLRRTGDRLPLGQLTTCPHCQAAIPSHRICPSCGYYRGRQVLTVQASTKESKEK